MKTKLKSRKTAVKRFSRSATGKLMRGKTGLNHLMGKKDSARKRALHADAELDKGSRKRITRMLGQASL